MNYQNRALLEELAAQYVIGTLRGPARRRFEQLCDQDIDTLTAVQRWEDRLVGLASTITPVRPSDAVWRRIQERVRPSAAVERSRRSRGWRPYQWALAASLLMMVGAMTLWSVLTSPATQVIATIADQQQVQLWRIEATADRDKLHVEAFAALRPDNNQAYELWALSASGGPPVSLGLMPHSDELELRLNPTQRAALTSATQVAISLEPAGGSPTGAPTGPVLYVATLVAG